MAGPVIYSRFWNSVSTYVKGNSINNYWKRLVEKAREKRRKKNQDRATLWINSETKRWETTNRYC